MSKFSTSFLAVSVVCAVIGFSGVGGGIVTGLSKALFGTFLILFFIGRFFGRETA